MRKEKNKAVFFLVIMLAFLILSSCALWFFDLFSMEIYWALFLEIFGVILFSALLSWICMRLFLKEKEDQADKKIIEFHKRRLKKVFNQAWYKQAKSNSSPYQFPWYFFISDNSEKEDVLIEKMGFEAIEGDEADVSNSPIKFWLSDTSVLVSFSLSSKADSFQEQVDYLIQLIAKKRERQAINGVITALNVSDLLSLDDMEVSDCSKRYRSFIKMLNNRFGLSLPIYSLFTHMAEITDFCEVFSTLDEKAREKPFGALMPVTSLKGFDKEWFDNSFDTIQKDLSNSISLFLTKQLNSEYRESLISGLFQINALRTDLEGFLERLFYEHHYDDKPLYFRGYFFVNAGQESSHTDLLSMMHASDLGYQKFSTSNSNGSSLSLFNKDLVRKYIVRESKIVGVNRRKETVFRLTKTFVYSGLFCTFIGFLVLIKANFDYQQTLDQNANIQLDQYKENLKSNVIISDDLSSPVFSVYELREIYLSYQAETPWYVTDYLPDSSIEKVVKNAYYSELKGVLLDLMNDYLMKDMFVYSKLDDKVKSLQLLNIYQILFDPHREDVDVLVNYYVNALTEEGEGEGLLLNRFAVLAKDLFATTAIPESKNIALVELVRSSLTSEDMSELLYQHILQHPDFRKRIDLRKKLGPSYQDVFNFKDGYSGYLIPYLFTAEGFKDLYTSTGFELASEAIQSYEGVMGRLNGEAEINRINRQLRDRYIEDYIRYWKDFASNVEWVPTQGWGDSKQQLLIASDAIFSPLTYFYKLIDENTRLKFSDSAGEDPKALVDEMLKDQKETANRVALSIQTPFAFINKLVSSDDTGQSQLGLALSQMKKTLSWVEQYKDVKSRELYFFEQLNDADSSNPLSLLSEMSVDYQDEILPKLLEGQAYNINNLAMKEVENKLDKDWGDVFSFYNKYLKGRYPVSKTSSKDINISDFKAFFGDTGVVNSFLNKYQSNFDPSENDELVINSFLPNQYIVISERFKSFVTSWKNVRSTLFDKGVPSFTFYMKAESLSPDLTKLTVSGEGSLFSYSNGPALWKKLEWPTAANVTSELMVKLEDTEGNAYVNRVDGVWNWMRLIDLMGGARLPGSDDVSLVYKNNKSKAILRIKSDSEFSALMPDFFSGLQVPDIL
ncbi:type VI secretion system membrane subunit TssM [Marinomonas posidonica]|uniref:Type VI secretion protein IcmF n=1 Tax=Marinomonas posidonica (strain CECT 7376 / NCIMB 14433 / IVIA-Po-181) TaxID=491952 RepID=F6D100_MARPP|nr:type VI secretion system membrane subunit TssM [Marinomonas posidonica]AEF53723.1 type VI secretion protein IcmF [Marinomonas posidonica IVIA-Po-181]